MRISAIFDTAGVHELLFSRDDRVEGTWRVPYSYIYPLIPTYPPIAFRIE